MDSSVRLLHELEVLSNTSAAVTPPTNPPGSNRQSANPPTVPPSVMRSKRMSSVSEQEHLNPRDPLYYAPRPLRERSTLRGTGSQMPFAPTSFDSQLESAVSDALRHPLDPELMHEPGLESKKALWTVAARFAAAIGVAALVALFFVVAVPGSRQSDGETSASTFANVMQSIRNALSSSGEASQKPALNEFQALLASTPPSAPAASEQDTQLLKQFMQWREKPDPAAPQRTTP